MSDMVDGWKGSWNARLLATYQPVINNSVLIPGAPFTRMPDPSTRITCVPELQPERLEHRC